MFIPELRGSESWINLLILIGLTTTLITAGAFLRQRDQEELQRQSSALVESQEQLQSILDNSTAVIYLKDIRGRYLLVNRQYETVFQVRRAEMIGKTAADIFPKAVADTYWARDLNVMRTDSPEEVEETVADAKGERTYLSVKFPLHDPSGKPYAVCSISTDITARKQAEEALREQSVRDPLTGLFNRRYLEETLERELSRAERRNHPLGVIMIDIDRFKRFNDTFGHAAGDDLLRELSGFLPRHIRGADIACRYGGEEFILILPEASLEVSLERAEHIRQEFKQLRVQTVGQMLNPGTLSLGAAVFPDHGANAEAVLRAVDAALYRAKREGRDRVAVAD